MDLPSALEWISRTLFFIRATRNPEKYGFRKDMSLDDQLQGTFWSWTGLNRCCIDHLRGQLGRLKRIGLACFLASSQAWMAASWTVTTNGLCLSIRSMEILNETSVDSPLEIILQQVCRAIDQNDCKLHLGDKTYFQKLSSQVRFKLTGKVSEAWHKAYIAIQVLLNRDDNFKGSYSFHRDAKVIFEKVKKLIRCQAEILRAKGAAITLRNVLELEGILCGKVWHDSREALQQIEGIGASYSKLLCSAGISTIPSLQTSDPYAIETALKRHTPFGLTLREASLAVPKMTLSCTVLSQDDGKKHLRISYSSLAKSRCYCALLVTDKRRETATVLYYDTSSRNTDIAKEIPLYNDDVEKELMISWMCLSHGKFSC